MLQFYDTLTSRGFEVDIAIPEKPMYAHANEEALERILNNLISNAIHHGGDGQAIGIQSREEEGFILIDVWDRGKAFRSCIAIGYLNGCIRWRIHGTNHSKAAGSA